MRSARLWISLLGSIPLAVAAASVQGTSERVEVAVPAAEAPPLPADETPVAEATTERWEALGGFYSPAAKEAFRSRVAPADLDYVCDLGARLILPGREGLAALPVHRPGYCYLQFEGALSAAERRDYVLLGVRFEAALRGHTYLARVDRRAHALLAADPRLRGVEPIHPADKLTRGLWEGRAEEHARRPDGAMGAWVRFHAGVELDHALAVLERWDVPVVDARSFSVGERIEVTVTRGQALVLAEEPSVLSLYEPKAPQKDLNHFAALLSNVNNVQAPPYDLSGAGVRVGQWELQSPVDTHPQFSGRLTIEQDNGASDHATHVACTIMGDGVDDADAMGMAPGLDHLYAYTERGDEAREMVEAQEDYGISAVNCSYGTITGWDDDGDDHGANYRFGRYDTLAGLFDHVVLGKELSMQVAAGNDGNDCSPDGTECDGVLGSDGIRYHTIAEQGNAKNIITVGAVQSAFDLTDFSSCGPTDDARIKPDLVAKGNQLWSAWANGVTEGDCPGIYCHLDGTSMSTPVVTGTVALLVEQYRQVYGGASPSAATLKAVLINSATDMGRPGPDYAFGHGLLDALAAAETIAVGPVRIMNDSVTNGETRTYYLEVPPSMWQDLKVTGVWSDIPGRPSSDDPDLVHDLDLRVVAPDGTVHFPYSGPTASDTDPATNTERNSRDNVEVVLVEDPAVGIWTVEMRGTSIPIGPQAYAIVANASFFAPDQPNIEVGANLVFDEHCVDAAPAERAFTIYNTGGAPLAVHSVEVTEGATDFSLAPLPSPPFLIQPGGQMQMTVLFHPQVEGVCAGNLRIVSNDVDEGTLDLELEGLGSTSSMDYFVESAFFGRGLLGETATREVLITNSSECPMEVTSIARTFGSEDYRIEGDYDFPIVVFPGEQLSFHLAWTPTVYGSTFATFETETTADPFWFGFACGGNSPPSEIKTTGTLDFGEACGGELPERQLMVSNAGFNDLVVSDVRFLGACPDCTIVDNPFPATLVAGSGLAVTVRFTPTSYGAHTCDLRIESNDPLTPDLVIPATGDDGPPELFVEGTVAFGTVCAGELAEQDLEICNTGQCDLEVYSLEFDPACGDFTLVGDPFPASIGSDACLPVTIRYTPGGAGNHWCNLVLTCNDPETPIAAISIVGSTPETTLDVPPDVAFPPTVIQDVAACGSSAPFPVTNVGVCPVTITGFGIVQAGSDYSVVNLPALPVTLLPGEQLGDGLLELVFTPETVARHLEAQVEVTYVTNLPAVGDTEMVTRNLCGEGARTGVRMLVTEDDLPVAKLEFLEFYRVYYPDTVNESLGVVTFEANVTLRHVAEDPPCAEFDYHREWGALDDPRVLVPGTYQVSAKVINSEGLLETRIARFELGDCDFRHDLRIDY